MRYSILLFVLTSLFGCSDYTKDLSGGYFFRGEGGTINDILSYNPDQREIPSNILRYNYNKDFIIAEQKPNETDDPLYMKNNYRFGRDKIYYWLIVHHDKQVIGPMTKQEYDSTLIEYNVPKDLALEKINE